MRSLPWSLAPLALLADIFAGDPAWLPHPVAAIGRMIGFLDAILRDKRLPPAGLVARGALLWCVVVAVTYASVQALIGVAWTISAVAGEVLAVWLASTTVAANGLGRAARKIRKALDSGDLTLARKATAEIVGRDTDSLSEAELVRAAVESVAENTVDGVISPLFYAMIGGAPLAMAYRAVNTMDSMLGYKDADYLYFGRPAARLDDLANYVPARITGLVMCIAAFITGNDAKSGFRVWMRDAKSHPSPNAGIPESVMAGALGVRLGGLNYYDGVPRQRATMGDASREFEPKDIDAACEMMFVASFISATLFLLAGFFLSRVLM